MGWRTIVVNKNCKLSYKNDYLIIRSEDLKMIHLSEINMIIIENCMASITSYLINELANKKIKLIICDEKHNPSCEMMPYYGSFNTSKKILNQIAWKKHKKEEAWKKIVEYKIHNQAMLLKNLEIDGYQKLLEYEQHVELADKTNREGHAAKVYFNELFGKNFSRNDNNSINAALNYGYAVLLSTINKEIISNGYLTQLGIHHKNEFNEFNLTCDIMEPFRVIIDNFVYFNKEREFDSNYKLDIVNIFNNTYKYSGKKYILKDIIKMFVKNTLDAMNEIERYKGYVYDEG